eukprot:scaffold38751_cov15-Tisochrysis_lutea.AAC.1
MLEHISSVCAILKKREGTYCKPPKPSACYLLGNIHFMNLLKNLSVHSKKAPFSNFRDNLHHFDQSRNFTGLHTCSDTLILPASSQRLLLVATNLKRMSQMQTYHTKECTCLRSRNVIASYQGTTLHHTKEFKQSPL